MAQLAQKVPQLFSAPGRLLYVGARGNRTEGLVEMIEAGHEITVLEIWGPNADFCRKWVPVADVVQADVRDVDNCGLGRFKAVFWWHGPEHVNKSEVAGVLEKLEAIADLVVLGCPWGIYEQGPEGGNPFERHLSYLYSSDFEALGYETATLGRRDVRGSHLLAWKSTVKGQGKHG